jgi:hypothetical protein
VSIESTFPVSIRETNKDLKRAALIEKIENYIAKDIGFKKDSFHTTGMFDSSEGAKINTWNEIRSMALLFGYHNKMIYWWRKPEFPEKNPLTCRKSLNKLYHIMLYLNLIKTLLALTNNVHAACCVFYYSCRGFYIAPILQCRHFSRSNYR